MFNSFDLNIKSKIDELHIDINNVEIEYRCKITKECLINTISKLSNKSSPTLHQSVDIISHYDNNSIICTTCNNITVYRSKVRIANMFVNNDIKLVASYESILGNVVDIGKYARIKSRLSFIIGIWRYDLTLVISTNNICNIYEYENSLFNNIDRSNSYNTIFSYIRSADNRLITSYELEIELITTYNISHLYASDPFNVF